MADARKTVPHPEGGKNIRKTVNEYLLCVAGALFVAVGAYFFKFPNNFSIGGVNGISVILGNYFGLSSAGIIAAIINYALLILGFIVLGRGSDSRPLSVRLPFLSRR